MAEPKSMASRVLAELRQSPAVGQHALALRVLGTTYTIAEFEELRDALRWHMAPPATVIEEKRQLPGTGHEGPPVYEYTYRVATAEERARYGG